jgi:hypothetical protein
METACEQGQSGGYHYSLHRSPVSCSDTLGDTLRDIDLHFGAPSVELAVLMQPSRNHPVHPLVQNSV